MGGEENRRRKIISNYYQVNVNMLYLYFTTLTSGLKIRMTLGGIDFHHMSSQSRLVPECLNAELAVMTLYLTVCQHVTI